MLMNALVSTCMVDAGMSVITQTTILSTVPATKMISILLNVATNVASTYCFINFRSQTGGLAILILTNFFGLQIELHIMCVAILDAKQRSLLINILCVS